MITWWMLACAEPAPSEPAAPAVAQITIVHEGRGENEIEPCG